MIEITEFYSKEDCIAEFNNLINNNPDSSISRDFFRENSEIPESSWVKHFGTFTEFKRAVGIIPSRIDSKLSSQIARFASLDKVRDYNETKGNWGEKYLRPTSKRFQSILVGSDMHDIECDLFYRRLFIETALRAQPEKIILNGDVFDLPEFGKYNVDPRTYKLVERVKWVHSFIADLRNAAPDSEITFIEGNHEARLLKKLADDGPAIQILLSDIHGMRIEDLLGLSKFEVNFHANVNLATYSDGDMQKELAKNNKIVNGQVMFHHFPVARNYGMPGISGHNHKFASWNHYSPIFGSYQWHQIGCGHKRHASYTDGAKWQVGFALVHLDTQTKRTQFELIDCTNAHCFIGGTLYQRNNKELESFI